MVACICFACCDAGSMLSQMLIASSALSYWRA
jgi:hypothetical protein